MPLLENCAPMDSTKYSFICLVPFMEGQFRPWPGDISLTDSPSQATRKTFRVVELQVLRIWNSSDPTRNVGRWRRSHFPVPPQHHHGQTNCPWSWRHWKLINFCVACRATKDMAGYGWNQMERCRRRDDELMTDAEACFDVAQ